MKAIRRSIKGEKHESRPHHISITPKSAIAILPPKKVIKALQDYVPQPQDVGALGFSKGDFFHVISREDDPVWYEACNPLIPSARGLVPVQLFEIIGKTERQSTGSAASGASNQLPDSGYSTSGSHGRSEMAANQQTPNTAKPPGHVRMSSMGKGAMVYGIVQYDFNAERPDELEAKAGEYIIVIAQSNPEWFVAKPIGRLGGPGLIPVSFIEIRDMSTGQAVPDAQKAVQQAGVPKVEEWKKLAADYKNSSITLGKFEAANAGSVSRDMERMSLNPSQQQAAQGGYGQQQQQQQQQQGYHQQNEPQARHSQHLLAPVSASIPRYCFENDKYWYIIECVLEDGSHWELSRFYQNFYDFQINLLQDFPQEAATDGGQRILPFMPGPVTYVTDAISNGRRESLDTYVKKLLSLPPYISRCQLVRQLFAPREGDFELDPKAMAEEFRLSGVSQHSSSAAHSLSQQSSQGQMNGNNAYGSYAQQHNQRNHPGTSQSPYQGSISSIQRQQSSLTSPQGNGSTTNVAASGALKLKVFFEDDLIAIRVPGEITFEQLRERLRERLKIREEIMIQYKDEPSGGYAELLSDRDLDVALQRNPKLTLYVGYA